MTPTNDDESLIARVLADALRGHLRITVMDYARIATAARRIRSERVAPLTLAYWLAADPAAAAVLRQALRLAPGATPDGHHPRGR